MPDSNHTSPVDRLAAKSIAVQTRVTNLERAVSRLSSSTGGRVRRSGDTMTGSLAITGGGLTVSGTITANGNNLTFQQGGGWYMADTTWIRAVGSKNIYTAGAIQGDASLATSGPLSCGPINGYALSTGAVGNTVACRQVNGYLFATYFNCVADIGGGWPTYLAGQNGDNYLRWYNRAGVLNNGSYQFTNGVQITNGWDSGLLISPGSVQAGVSFHPGGVIGCLFTPQNNNAVYVRNINLTAGSSSVAAAAFVVESSRRFKKNIASWPPKSLSAAALNPSDVLSKLRVVTFDYSARDVQAISERRSKALVRLNTFKRNRDLPEWEEDEHDCGAHECPGTADDPCARTLNQNQSRFGMVAEEVIEHVPEAVRLGDDRQPEGIDYGQLTVIAIATIQELTTRVESLESSRQTDGQ